MKWSLNRRIGFLLGSLLTMAMALPAIAQAPDDETLADAYVYLLPSKPCGKFALVKPGYTVKLPADASPIALHSSNGFRHRRASHFR